MSSKTAGKPLILVDSRRHTKVCAGSGLSPQFKPSMQARTAVPHFCRVLMAGEERLLPSAAIQVEEMHESEPPRRVPTKRVPRAQAMFRMPLFVCSSFRTFLPAIPYLVLEFVSVAAKILRTSKSGLTFFFRVLSLD